MVVNDNAYLLAKRGALDSIASKLAPTQPKNLYQSGMRRRKQYPVNG